VTAKVHNKKLMDSLGRVSYILADKTGTITQNKMVFKKMSINGVCYGDDELVCDDAAEKGVTNFDMVD